MSKTERSRALRRTMTDAERLLWGHLRGQRLSGFRFRRQHPLGRYIVDFVCLDRALVIEVDGNQHAEQRAYDEDRELWLEAEGFRTIRFANVDVLTGLETVKQAILDALNH